MSNLTKDVMKHTMKNFVKLEVLKSEPRMDFQNKEQQERDKDGELLWDIGVKEEIFNEEFNMMETVLTKYKSTLPLDKGPQIVELKATQMGQASGDFVSINSYYKIIQSLDMNAKIGDIFSLQGTIPPSKRKAAKAQETATVQ